jgi:dTDP-glucose 4,6-dehydratase
VGGLNERTNLEVVQRLCVLLDRQPRQDGRSSSSLITRVADRPGHDRRYAIDCSKLCGELGWSPTESFESGLEKTVAWYLANRSWCEDITASRYARERLGATPC